MNLIFYIIISAGFIVFQTIICPGIPLLNGFYDILTPFVIYLSLYRPVRETIPAVLCLGLAMDNLTGGPFGLYLTTYLWLFISIRWMLKYLLVGNTFLLPLVVVIGVFIENMVFLSTLAMLTPEWRPPDGTVRRVGVQLVWSALTGVFFLILVDICWNQWSRVSVVLRFRKDAEDG